MAAVAAAVFEQLGVCVRHPEHLLSAAAAAVPQQQQRHSPVLLLVVAPSSLHQPRQQLQEFCTLFLCVSVCLLACTRRIHPGGRSVLLLRLLLP